MNNRLGLKNIRHDLFYASQPLLLQTSIDNKAFCGVIFPIRLNPDNRTIVQTHISAVDTSLARMGALHSTIRREKK